MDVKIQVRDVDRVRRSLGVVLSRDRLVEMNRHMGSTVLERVRDHLDQMAPSRHKTADRLGAKPTHHFEYASGRVSGSDGQGTELNGVSERGFTVTIRNTPGLLRAFGPVTIRPKRARWLTIPIHRDAYGKGARDLREEGRVLFRPGKARILAESVGKGRLRPLYALCKSATVPKDSGLLPTKEAMRQWATEAAEDFLLTE